MTDNDLKVLLEANAAETRRHFDVAVERLETKVEGLETKGDLVAAETRRHFDVASEEIKHEIRLVAEKVTQVDEKLDREAAHIREEMRRGWQARVERLEASTH